MSDLPSSLNLALTPEDNSRLANLCGQMDEHLRQIERRLGIEINNRGSQFQLIGEAEAIRAGEEVLKGLLSVLGAGGNIASYLRQKYNDIMFKKIMKEREYEKSLAVYENIFTILLFVAPLLVFIFIMLGEIISPGMFDSVFMLQLMVYMIMPVGNVMFIAMLKIFKNG